jgi:glutamate synthase domain-containing protein 3
MTKGVVVVLGSTGRNFAAGMTGGIAYVLDEAGQFAARCNPAGVDLEPVTEPGDLEALHDLIARHCEHTRSPRALEILIKWDEYLPRFVKVFPHEYRRCRTSFSLSLPRQAEAYPTGVLHG